MKRLAIYPSGTTTVIAEKYRPVVSDTTRTFEVAQAQFHMGVASLQIERTVPDRWRQIVRHRINSLDGNARRARWAVY